MKLLTAIASFIQSLRLVQASRDAREQYLAGAATHAELEDRQRRWDRSGPLGSW